MTLLRSTSYEGQAGLLAVIIICNGRGCRAVLRTARNDGEKRKNILLFFGLEVIISRIYSIVNIVRGAEACVAAGWLRGRKSDNP